MTPSRAVGPRRPTTIFHGKFAGVALRDLTDDDLRGEAILFFRRDRRMVDAIFGELKRRRQTAVLPARTLLNDSTRMVR